MRTKDNQSLLYPAEVFVGPGYPSLNLTLGHRCWSHCAALKKQAVRLGEVMWSWTALPTPLPTPLTARITSGEETAGGRGP